MAEKLLLKKRFWWVFPIIMAAILCARPAQNYGTAAATCKNNVNRSRMTIRGEKEKNNFSIDPRRKLLSLYENSCQLAVVSRQEPGIGNQESIQNLKFLHPRPPRAPLSTADSPSSTVHSQLSIINCPLSITNNPFRYGNYYTDIESGLNYCGARYYSPDTMSWISRDSWEVGNRYAYCGNDPVEELDSTGHAGMAIHAESTMMQENRNSMRTKITLTTIGIVYAISMTTLSGYLFGTGQTQAGIAVAIADVFPLAVYSIIAERMTAGRKYMHSEKPLEREKTVSTNDEINDEVFHTPQQQPAVSQLNSNTPPPQADLPQRPNSAPPRPASPELSMLLSKHNSQIFNIEHAILDLDPDNENFETQLAPLLKEYHKELFNAGYNYKDVNEYLTRIMKLFNIND